ncbi:hypothetical protein CON65_03255 [Bacillus pseudomycoides]|uniref:DUF4362 domain-containing protein n=1 Tax=Bacillus pseudomycoides TaxID=64104 RepID=A0AA91VET6_9BACI|nr:MULTISPECIES: DUF4362 domain-containing protein [Bacillus]PEB50396.1 hypothetical protein COO03_22665 [Bacillus sp. AFS098217]PED84002.1 hypothetical protein CON65_03255 [Bacillus pseudomycoides]PEU10462.1 hypothetical protein CN524_16635 [Bacillus sp. AFS019443]PEU18305.1 hypothetical protein CN525_12195 [Bacillus sp. AFS014408]PFW60307.1 hypothetical protein COL20_22280 [Bacillus sp. AFS075034]
MRKGIALLCFLFCIGSLVGCVSSTKSTGDNQKDDIVEKVSGVTNLDKFEKFLVHVKNGQSDKVRIVHYTDEGDPIFQTLDYDGMNINYTFDDSNDKFGSTHKGKKSDVCRGILKEESKESVNYKLSECQKNLEYINYFLVKVPNE